MYDYYIYGIILLPGLLLSIYASIKVENTFRRYNEIKSENGLPTSEVIKNLLIQSGLTNILVTSVRGHLTDHYNHRKKTIALNSSVYNSSSVSALGVACHELGHALQYKDGYLPIKIRNLIIPICNFANSLLWVFIILGAILYYTNLGQTFILIGIIIFSISILLNLVTLPVEYNASKRALKLLKENSILNSNEIIGAKKVLDSAALTYVAGLVISILNLLRFILAFRRRD
jgi:Zn-dependent membrane protease YugP